MPSYEVLTSGDEVTKIVNSPMKARFPKAELLSLLGFILVLGLISYIWPQYLLLVVLMLPFWLMVLTGIVLFPLGWLLASRQNRGKGQTEITLSDGKLKVEAKGRELLNIDVDQISSIRIGNRHEKVEGYNTIQKLFGVHRWAETMFYLEARFRGRTQIIAWGLDEPSADGLLYELGFTETR